MNQFTNARMRNGIIRYQNLTVGDVRPDATTKLYQRMFKGVGRKYIPVKDVTNDNMGRELNAFLINPEYIDKSVLDPSVLLHQLEPKPVNRVIQYSRLTYNRPKAVNNSQTTARVAAVFAAALSVGKRAVMKAKNTVVRVATTALHSPFGRTYSIGSGMALHKRRKIFLRASGLVALASFGIIGLQGMNSQQPVLQPKPGTSSSSSSVNNPLTSAGNTVSQPIPIYTNKSGGVTTPTSPATAEPNYAVVDSKQADALVSAPTSSVIPQTSSIGSKVEAASSTVAEEPIATATQEVNPISSSNEEALIPNTIDTVVDTTSQTLDNVTRTLNNLL